MTAMALPPVERTPQHRGRTVHTVAREIAPAQMTRMPCGGERRPSVQDALVVEHHDLPVRELELQLKARLAEQCREAAISRIIVHGAGSRRIERGDRAAVVVNGRHFTAAGELD